MLSKIPTFQIFNLGICTQIPVPRAEAEADRKLKPGGWRGATSLKMSKSSMLGRSTWSPRVTPLRVFPVCDGDPARAQRLQGILIIFNIIFSKIVDTCMKIDSCKADIFQKHQPQGIYLKA